MKTYLDFKEVEQEIKELMPPLVYKFRTWENDDHKKTITDTQLWFAHPFTLNDPFEMRPPIKFVFEDIDWEIAKEKLRSAGRYFEPNLTPQQLEEQVEIRITEMKKNPEAYFRKNQQEYNADEKHYNQIGILSCCLSCENESMWAHYGNNHNGFAIGFNTVEFARALNCTVTAVEYSDEPLEYRPFGNNEEAMEKKLYRKSTKWKQEDEVRFATAGIGIYRNRLTTFPPSTVKEIVFGMNMSQDAQKQIQEEANKTMPHVAFFRMQRKIDSYGLDKVAI